MTKARSIFTHSFSLIEPVGISAVPNRSNKILTTIITQVTDTDIGELKTAIEGIDRRIETLTLTTEANARAIADLTSSVTGLREEMQVGFSDMRGQITNLETKLDGEIKTVNSRLSNLESTAAKLPNRAEKVGELKNWKQIAIVVFTASVSGAIAWFVRGGTSNR